MRESGRLAKAGHSAATRNGKNPYQASIPREDNRGPDNRSLGRNTPKNLTRFQRLQPRAGFLDSDRAVPSATSLPPSGSRWVAVAYPPSRSPRPRPDQPAPVCRGYATPCREWWGFAIAVTGLVRRNVTNDQRVVLDRDDLEVRFVDVSSSDDLQNARRLVVIRHPSSTCWPMAAIPCRLRSSDS